MLPGQLTADESLFTYPDGMTVADYAFPDHVPPYLDEVLAAATPEVLSACGANKMCIYDAVETNDIAIGLDTMETVNRIEADEKLACEYFVQY